MRMFIKFFSMVKPPFNVFYTIPYCKDIVKQNLQRVAKYIGNIFIIYIVDNQKAS